MALLGFLADSASAHTKFDSSTPSVGQVVEGPLTEIELVFTNEARQTAEGFLVLDPQRGKVEPDEVEKPRRGVFVLRFDEPISPGRVGVRWTVRAPDAHPISDTFAFQVRGEGAAAPSDDPEGSGAAPGLEEFLEADPRSRGGDAIARGGRAVAILGVVAALGLAVFGFFVLRGSGAEMRSLIGLIRLGGVLIVAGTVVDAAGQVMINSGGPGGLIDPGAWEGAVRTNLGVAWVLRLLGGAAVIYGARGEVVDARHPHPDPISSIAGRVPVASAAPRATTSHGDPLRLDARLRLDLTTVPLALGLALLLASTFSFDGHTVTEGNRLLMGAASAGHVLAGATWAAGIAALGWIIQGRRRRREPTGGLVLAARFSVVAGAALALVAAIGVYLSIVILDAPSELWETDWGLVLIAKVAVVAVAAAIGAYNHFRAIPELEASGEKPAAVARLSRSLRGEAALMAVVIILSAILVRASSIP